MKTHYVIYIPSFCCLVSCDTIAVTASTTRKFVGNLDDCDSAIVSFDLILGSLAMCLLEDTEEERWDAIDWQQGPPQHPPGDNARDRNHNRQPSRIF